MSNTLVIVESPTKAKTIGKFLGRNYSVKSSMGHIRDLPKSQLGVDVENGFEPKYITIRGKGETLKELKEAAKKADHILLAADPDREGEAIAWHLGLYLGANTTEECRIEFNEITKGAIQEAVKHPRRIDMDRVDAQQARRVLDRLVGYKLSPLLWKKVRKGLSAGRVQSVAVRMICDREAEIDAFISEEYWSLAGIFAAGDSRLSAKLFKIAGEKAVIPDKKAMDDIMDGVKGLSYAVENVSSKEKKRNPAPPFTTSSLQQEAYRKLGFTAKRTMQTAQQLYEGIDLGKEGSIGLVTYIRTDSVRVAETAQADARALIGEKYGTRFMPENPRQYESKGKIQNAHEAIRPSSVLRRPDTVKDFLKPPQLKLYKLIWERFVASQMSPATLEVTTVDIKGGDYLFRASGTVIQFPGFMQVYIEGRDDVERDDDGIIPQVKAGQSLTLEKLDPRQHFTQPPPRFTEATIVKTLEEQGIGRPSTYAPIIDTIIARGYVLRQEKQFVPTELGKIVVDLLKNYFPNVIDVEFTAGMEKELDSVEEGAVPWKEVISTFYGPFAQTLEKAEEEIGQIQIEDEESDEICEKCGRRMVYKLGRFGKFLACPGFPECRNAKPILKEIGVKCPECSGEVVERKGKRGRTFYGCSRYPECQYVSWDKPAGVSCPQCGGPMVEKIGKSRETTLVCPKCAGDKERDMKNDKTKDLIQNKTKAKTTDKTTTKSVTKKADKTAKKTAAKETTKSVTKKADKTAKKTAAKETTKSTTKTTKKTEAAPLKKAVSRKTRKSTPGVEETNG